MKNYSDTVAVVEVDSAVVAVAVEDIAAADVGDIAVVGGDTAVVVVDTADVGDTGQVLTS